MNKRDPRWSALAIGGLCLGPLVLGALPADFFDTGTVVCLSRRLFDLECWGCGMTRAVMHAINGEWSQAWAFNRLVIVVLPLMVLLWVRYCRMHWARWKNRDR
ncbi:MAG: DUF2752 domain-containing protein [Bacteroidia bacterium]